MNYLAHAYLSFGHAEITVGNLVSDFVKVKKKFDFPAGIQIGITLHRNIDSFTDDSEATKRAKEFFRPAYRLYSGAFVDVLYDHYLANDKDEFTEESLFDFSQSVYAIMDLNRQNMPDLFARMYPYMKGQNWLFNYHTKEGIKQSFRGLVRRSAYLAESDTAFELFQQYDLELKACYKELIPAIKIFARQRIGELTASL